jgi:hypothetical protein
VTASRLGRKQYFLPSEHGAWIWWIGPLLIGLAAAGSAPPAALLLGGAALAGFLLRQPAAIVVKVLSGRRPSTDLVPGLFWAAVDSLLLLGLTTGLVSLGHVRVLVLAVPGVLVFFWHLSLISRRQERGQMGVELVGAGVLALSGPAAYWVAGGDRDLLAWILWLLCWLQAAASIVLVYLRLEQRRLVAAPAPEETLRRARRPIAYHLFNVILASGLAACGQIPWLFAVGFLLMALDLGQGLLSPPVGVKPTRIGLRQLAASSLFTLLAAIGFAL